jgi:hypothetical protein
MRRWRRSTGSALVLPDASLTYYQQQQQIGVLTAATLKRVWGRMSTDFDSSWAGLRAGALAVLANGQLSAARASTGYVDNVLAETGQDGGDIAGAVDPSAFAGYASDGRDLGTLLDQAPIIAKARVGAGQTAVQGLAAASQWMTMVGLTQVADASRGFISADMGAHSKVTGYVRMLVPPSCPRCVVLAGKWFRYNTGFQRHPHCDCRHVPATENIAGDLTTDPYAYFKSLTKEQQEATFGRIEARAISDGGDIYRVVNISQRGMPATGSKQAIKYGTPRKLTVDQIYRTAGTRANAIQMMKDEGYITGAQVAGGNILGNAREGFGQLGKGGKARAASDTLLEARRTGVRNPLNRYTMTAAERRLYDARTRLDAAEKGIYLNSVGANSADKFNRPQKPTLSQLASLRKNYANELARLRGNPARGIKPAPKSVQTLAAALGIRL